MGKNYGLTWPYIKQLKRQGVGKGLVVASERLVKWFLGAYLLNVIEPYFPIIEDIPGLVQPI